MESHYVISVVESFSFTRRADYVREAFIGECDIEVRTVADANVANVVLFNFWYPDDAYETTKRVCEYLRDGGCDVVYSEFKRGRP